MAWKCMFCVGFSALYLSLLLTHFNSSHRDETDVTIQCRIDGCTRTFEKVNTLVKHVQTKHQQFLFCINRDKDEGPRLLTGDPDIPNCNYDNADEVNTVTTQDSSTVIEANSSDCSHQANNTITVDNEMTMQDVAGRYLVKIKEGNRLSNRATQNIVAATSQLFNMAFKKLETRIEQSLADVGIDIEDVPGISDSFEEISSPFDRLMSSWRQTEHIRNDPKFVEPVKKVVGTKPAVVKRKNKKQIVEVEESFYYIPILETIQLQLDSPKFLEMIVEGQKPADNPHLLRDFCDGAFVGEHPLFNSDEHALRILMYYDDVNVVNPKNNKIHQLGFFYYQLANLPPEFRSKLKSIQLFTICRKDIIKKYGLNTILQPFIEDLKILGSNTGHPFNVGRGTWNLRGALLAGLADTPASQAIGGFKEGVGGARRKCRHCMATFAQMQECFFEEDFTLRSKEEHEKQLQKIENAPSKYLASFYSKEYGVNARANLLEAPYFDVTQQLPQDIMHVFLEGILSNHLKFFLHHCITESGLLTLDQLNREIRTFSLGYSQEQDRPVIIKETDLDQGSSTNLGQTASQMNLLAYILPFIISKYTDMEESAFCQCYMTLLEIMVICFSPRITTETAIYLRGVIAKHLKTYRELYDARITPKMHYLVHLPSIIMKFGPLIRTWCMRFEAKHSYFKDLSRVIKNFKNLPYSLSMRHQTRQFADNINLDNKSESSLLFNSEHIQFGKFQLVSDKDGIKYIKDFLRNLYNIEYTQDDGLYTLTSVTIHGTCYKPGINTFLAVNDLPEFGRLMKIWYIDGHGVYFSLHVLDTVGFDETLNSYEIREPDLPQANEILSTERLSSPRIYHTHKFKSKLFIIKREIFP